LPQHLASFEPLLESKECKGFFSAQVH
jgi:hypothetical protein